MGDYRPNVGDAHSGEGVEGEQHGIWQDDTHSGQMGVGKEAIV